MIFIGIIAILTLFRVHLFHSATGKWHVCGVLGCDCRIICKSGSQALCGEQCPDGQMNLIDK